MKKLYKKYQKVRLLNGENIAEDTSRMDLTSNPTQDCISISNQQAKGLISSYTNSKLNIISQTEDDFRPVANVGAVSKAA